MVVKRRKLFNLLLLYLLVVLIDNLHNKEQSNGRYRLSGLRTKRVKEGAGRQFIQDLLEGHPGRIRNITLLSKEAFLALVTEIRDAGVDDGDFISVKEKVLIFLCIAVYGQTNRVLYEQF